MVSLSDLLQPTKWRWWIRGHSDMTATGYAGGHRAHFKPTGRIVVRCGKSREFVVVVFPERTDKIERVDIRLLRRRTIGEWIKELFPRIHLGPRLAPGWDALPPSVAQLGMDLMFAGGMTGEFECDEPMRGGYRWKPKRPTSFRKEDAIHCILRCNVAEPNANWRVSVLFETTSGSLRVRHNMGAR